MPMMHTPRLRVAVEDDVGDGRGAAVPGQQRGVHIDAAEARYGQQGGWQDAPIGGDHHEIRPVGLQHGCRLGALHLGGRMGGDAHGLRSHFDRCGRELAAAACGLVRLADHGDHLAQITTFGEGLQGRDGEGGGAHEDDAIGRHGGLLQRAAATGASPALRRCILRLMTSRLRRDRYSTKTLPLR